MDGFKRPTGSQRPPRPQSKPATPTMEPARVQPRPVSLRTRAQATKELPVIKLPEAAPDTAPPTQEKRRRVPKLVWGIFGCAVLAVIGVAAAFLYLLSPKNAAATEAVPVEIVSGMLPGQIADTLEETGVIRSSLVFRVYARLSGVQNSLQAGNYQLSPADSTPEIARQLQKGPSIAEIEVLFRPGETLADNKKTLLALGYSAAEIDAAFTATYDHPLLEGRPGGSDLEGYVFGETHRFVKGTPVKDILQRYFDDYYAVIQENNLVSGFQKQGLNLYEGITLASIIQREVRSQADQKQVAQVFLDRLEIGMSLGADSTYEYIAKKTGVTPDPSLDSPYNTRKYTGLPPGPIASPGLSALIATANPAEGDYLYFVSGDDGVNHFSHTNAEHEAKVRQYCTTLCFGN